MIPRPSAGIDSDSTWRGSGDARCSTLLAVLAGPAHSSGCVGRLLGHGRIGGTLAWMIASFSSYG